MKFKIVSCRDHFSSGELFRFHGSFTNRELEELRLTPLDRAIIDSPETTADMLLALECIYRAHETARKAREVKS